MQDIPPTPLGAPEPPPWRVALPRLALRLLFVAVLVYLIHLLMNWAMMQVDLLDEANRSLAFNAVILVALIGYALLIAVPFVPGIEIGIALLLMRGAEVAPLVYIATLLGLMIAFTVGRQVPLVILRRTFTDLHMRRTSQLIDAIRVVPPEQRLDHLRDALPKALGLVVVNYRYVVLALLINIPGNALVGGGGGILLTAGLSRLFSYRATCVTLAIATAPVPLVTWQFGTGFLM
jgi:hypothetical protein